MRKLALRIGLVVAALHAPRLVADPCQYAAQPTGLPTRAGYAAFMTEARLAPFAAAMPHVDDPALDAVLRSPDTMWYDDQSMVFGYQDSIEFVVGFRANCVGRVIGELSRDHPQVGKLLRLFGPDFRFEYPFRTAAGTDGATNVVALNFWLPPHADEGAASAVLPVRWWKESGRGRWRWLFPKGSLLGEVLFQRSPDGALHPFEVRVRRRYLDGWAVAAYRPFLNAASLSAAIKSARPAWEDNAQLAALVAHLESDDTLEPATLTAPVFQSVFAPLTGALDKLPPFGDDALVSELLDTRTFQSAEGAIWKENGSLETYAASSAAAYSIVPKDYSLGLVPVNEDGCSRCHSAVGTRLGSFISDVSAYGEIWGEDRIFTWHLFEPSERIYGPWDDDQGSRQVNQRLTRAGLVQQGKPSAQDPNYRELPHASLEDAP
jgi:hypothetical protein